MNEETQGSKIKKHTPAVLVRTQGKHYTSNSPQSYGERRLSQILQIKVAIKLSINGISKHPVVGMGHS